MEDMKFTTTALISLGGLNGDRMEARNGNQGGRLEIDLNKMTQDDFDGFTDDLKKLVRQANQGNADKLIVTN